MYFFIIMCVDGGDGHTLAMVQLCRSGQLSELVLTFRVPLILGSKHRLYSLCCRHIIH